MSKPLISLAVIMAMSTMGQALPVMGEDSPKATEARSGRVFQPHSPTINEKCAGRGSSQGSSALSRLAVYTYHNCDGKVSTGQGKGGRAVVSQATTITWLYGQNRQATPWGAGLTGRNYPRFTHPLGNEEWIPPTQRSFGIRPGGVRGPYVLGSGVGVEANRQTTRGISIIAPE